MSDQFNINCNTMDQKEAREAREESASFNYTQLKYQVLIFVNTATGDNGDMPKRRQIFWLKRRINWLKRRQAIGQNGESNWLKRRIQLAKTATVDFT